MLADRGIDAEELKRNIAAGIPIAPTPLRPEFAQQGRGPSAAPAAPAGIPVYPMHGQGRQLTPQGTPAPPSQEVEVLQDKLKDLELELAAQRIAADQVARTPNTATDSMVEALRAQTAAQSAQTEAMLQALNKPKQQSSTIKVEPRGIILRVRGSI